MTNIKNSSGDTVWDSFHKKNLKWFFSEDYLTPEELLISQQHRKHIENSEAADDIIPSNTSELLANAIKLKRALNIKEILQDPAEDVGESNQRDSNF